MVHGHTVGSCLVCLLFGAGYGPLGSTTIDTSDYDQSCSTNDDCAVVDDGDACEVCSCGNASVNVSAEDAFRARYDELRGTCGPMPAIAGDCERAIAYRAGSTCQVRTAVDRLPAAFDQSCQADEDGVAVRGGEVCAPCGCADEAINAGALDDYNARRDGVECGSSALDCAQCLPPTVACQNNTCVIVE